MGIEGGVAWKYWNEFNKVIPDEYDFCSRIDHSSISGHATARIIYQSLAQSIL